MSDSEAEASAIAAANDYVEEGDSLLYAEDDDHGLGSFLSRLEQRGADDDYEAEDDEEQEPDESVVLGSPTRSPARKKRRTGKPRAKGSVAHEFFMNKSLVLLHVDIETGGEAVGIIQLSCVVQHVDPSIDNNTLPNFNEYVKPPSTVKNKYWTQVAMDITGLSPKDPRILNAAPIEEVWPRFKSYCEQQVPVDT